MNKTDLTYLLCGFDRHLFAFFTLQLHSSDKSQQGHFIVNGALYCTVNNSLVIPCFRGLFSSHLLFGMFEGNRLCI